MIDDHPPASGKTWTSRLAALKIEPVVGSMRRIVLDVIREHGPRSADEITKLGWSEDKHPYTVRPRLTELVDLGWLEKAPGAFKLNRQGNPEQVFQLTQEAIWRDLGESAKPALEVVK